MLRKAFAHCVRNVREHDYENYVWTVQLPKELRPAVFALRSFNVELAGIADQVKEKLVVPMRMQWWRDGVNGIFKDKPIRHPVIQCLHQVHLRQPLTRYRLQKIVNARELDLIEPDPPATLQQLESYAEGTASQLLQLQLEATGLQSKEADAVALQLGKAVGMAALLRGTGYHASRQRSYLPADLCKDQGIQPEEVLSGTASDKLREVVFRVASTAKGHLDDARAMVSDVPRDARPLLLPSVGAGLYLDALERADFDAFAPQLAKGGFSPLWHQLAVKWRLLRRAY